MLRLLAVAAASCALLAPAMARAQSECPVDGGVQPLPPDYGLLSSFFPSDRSHNVPTDGFVRLRYVGVAPDPAVVIVTNLATGQHEHGSLHVVGSEVFWQGDLPFAASTDYQVDVADPSVGGDTFQFTTAISASQAGPPVFHGVDTGNATFQREGTSDLCGDPDAIEVTLCWHPAADNGWPQSDVEYVIYQTRGPGIGGAVERARQRGQVSGSSCGDGTPNEFQRSFRLSSANASGGVCFNVQALDAYGRTDGNNAEVCVHPDVGNYFVGCDVARAAVPQPPPGRGRARSGLTVAAVAALSLGLVVVVRRGRRTYRG